MNVIAFYKITVSFLIILLSIDRVFGQEFNEDNVQNNFNTSLLFDLPLDINLATKEELISLRFLSLPQIEALEQYKRDYGQLMSLQELLLIPHWEDSNKKIDLDNYFKITNNKITIKETQIIAWFRTRTRWKDGKDELFEEHSLWNASNRRVHLILGLKNGIKMGIDAEMDAEEKNIDHLNYFLSVPLNQRWRFGIGNHQIAMSDQLTFGQQTRLKSYGEGTESLYWTPINIGFLPQLRTETTIGYNGISGIWKKNKISIGALGYYNLRDISWHPTIDNSGKHINFIGIHVSESQIKNKNNQTEYGGFININFSLKEDIIKGKLWSLWSWWKYPITQRPFLLKNKIFSQLGRIGYIQELNLFGGIFVLQGVWNSLYGWGSSFQYLRAVNRYFTFGIRGQYHQNILELQQLQIAHQYLQTNIGFNKQKKWFYYMKFSVGEKTTAIKNQQYIKQQYYLASQQFQWGRSYRKSLNIEHNITFTAFGLPKHKVVIDSRIYKPQYNVRSAIVFTQGWFWYSHIYLKKRKIKLGLSLSIFDIKDYNNRVYWLNQSLDFSRNISVDYGRGYQSGMIVKWKIFRPIQLQFVLNRKCKFAEEESNDEYTFSRRCNYFFSTQLLWRH